VRAALPAFHVNVFLSLSSLSVYLHTDLLKFSVVGLDVLEGGEGGVSSVLLLHVELLSPVPVNGHLGNFFVVLVLRMGTQEVVVSVLSVLLRLDGLLNLVLLVSLHVNCVLDKVYSGDDYWRILGILPRLVNLQ
jgi:hypothetical protein